MNSNQYQNQKERGLKRKYEYILSKGGKCECCGYNKNIAALEFHHKNPEEKEFQIDIRKFANANIETLKKELDKCIILCSNCHREIHHPDLTLENISKLSQISNKKSFEESTWPGTICSICGKKFRRSKGKKYCSKECRDKAEGRDKYPSKEEVNNKYSELKSWQKVANFYKLTRKIIFNIRKS